MDKKSEQASDANQVNQCNLNQKNHPPTNNPPTGHNDWSAQADADLVKRNEQMAKIHFNTHVPNYHDNNYGDNKK